MSDKRILLKGGNLLPKVFNLITQKEALIQIEILKTIKKNKNDISIELLLSELNLQDVSLNFIELLNDLLKDQYIEVDLKIELINKQPRKLTIYKLTNKGERYLESKS